jgi:hypothetical protein
MTTLHSGHQQRQRLVEFRAGFYRCLTCWGDALFELCDAALCAGAPVASVPRLSLEPEFRRSHGSLYKALVHGHLDAEDLKALVVEHRPRMGPEIFAVDASVWDRCDAECSPERGFYYSASKHSAGQPIVAGWSYQWISQLDFSADSWTAPLDARRIRPEEDTTTATIGQIKELSARLGTTTTVPLFVFDAGYDPIALTEGLAATRVEVLVRIRGDRVFYRDPPARQDRKIGRPRRHGKRLKLSDARTLGRPDAEFNTTDLRYGTVRVRAWHGVHPRIIGRGRWSSDDLPPIVRGSVLRVDVEHLPRPDGRAKKTLWLWWGGQGEPDLELCFRAYLRRFDLEHTFRFLKNTLGWTTPSLCTPEQADRWTWLIVAAYTQLRLARGLVDDLRMPWERPSDPTKLTPARVRRGFRRLRATISTPSSPPKFDRAGPGRPKGTTTGPRQRYPVFKKTA